MDDNALRPRRRALDPESAKARKFFSRGFGDVDGETAGGQSVILVARHRPKIARALEHDEFVLVIGAVQRIVQPKTGKLSKLGKHRPDVGRRCIEGVCIDPCRKYGTVLDDGDVDALLVKEPGRKELYREF